MKKQITIYKDWAGHIRVAHKIQKNFLPEQYGKGTICIAHNVFTPKQIKSQVKTTDNELLKYLIKRLDELDKEIQKVYAERTALLEQIWGGKK